MLGRWAISLRNIVSVATIAVILVLAIWWLTALGYDERHGPTERSVSEWIEFWLNRYQTFIGVLAATVVGWLAYAATKRTITSNEAIAERQIAQQLNDVKAAWSDVDALVSSNIGTARTQIAELKQAWRDRQDWPAWRERYKNSLAGLEFDERAAEIEILLPHLPTRRKVIGLRAIKMFHLVDEVHKYLELHVLSRLEAPDQNVINDFMVRLDYMDERFTAYLIINSSAAGRGSW